MNSHRSYAQGDYLLLYNVLRNSEKSCVLNKNSVDSAVNNLTGIVRESINVAISYTKSKNCTFPHWFSNSLKYYINTKNQNFRRYKKPKCDHHYGVFLIMADWLKLLLRQTGFVGWNPHMTIWKLNIMSFGNMSI
jgi:hypothetical protein